MFTCSLFLHCVTIGDPGRNGIQCYHRGDLLRSELTRGEIGKDEMEKAEWGRHLLVLDHGKIKKKKERKKEKKTVKIAW